MYPPRYQLLKPVSPYKPMDYEPDTDVQLTDIDIPNANIQDPLVVEGAGGIAVPVTKKMETMADLIKHLISNCNRPFYIIIVERSGLGTLNHTFLTVDYLHNVGLGHKILGIIVNGMKNEANVKVMKQLGLRILATVDYHSTTSEALSDIPSLNSLNLR